jgi:hypothetical protein
MYAGGKNSAEIINYCNDKGYKTSKGQEFNKNSVSRILTNEKYIGTYRHGDIVIENGIPSIIDKFLFDKVQAMLKKNYTLRARSKAKVEFLLSGKLFCGHCGESMTGESGTSKSGKKYYYYKCSGRKAKHTCNKENEQKDWLENVVIKTTVEQVLTNENIEMIATKAMELIDADNADTSELKYYEDELKTTQKQIKNIVDMIANGVGNKSVADRLTELESYENDVLENIEYLKIKKPTLTKEQIIYWLESFKHGDIDDVEYKRKVINTLIHSVHVYDLDGDKRRILIKFNTSANNQTELKCSTTDFQLHQKTVIRTPLCILSHMVFSYLVEIEKA